MQNKEKILPYLGISLACVANLVTIYHGEFFTDFFGILMGIVLAYISIEKLREISKREKSEDQERPEA